ncbi:hypothetical protein B0H14DRAFT_3027106, partial [Mycena olivaceomarginata]
MIICTYTGRLKFLAAEPSIRTLQSGRTGSLRVASAKGLFNASVDCSVVTRPQTRKAGVENQLSKLCICGSRLVHLACKVRSTLHTFSGGVYHQNGGTHDHPRPTVRLHL